ncbi:hypothetical protein CSPX01_10882 [Colletotrichum filicis]|nr:hypothetical protein CSPX01_10882 [Colletotrichum filicis]
MASNGTSADPTAPHEMGPENNNQPGPATGSSTGTTHDNPAAPAHQGISQADNAGDMEEQEMKKIQNLHAKIQEERKAQIEEKKREEAIYQAEKAEKERLQKEAQAQKDREQMARLQRAIQATSEEREAYETSLEYAETSRRSERRRAETLSSINGYLKRQGIKRR